MNHSQESLASIAKKIVDSLSEETPDYLLSTAIKEYNLTQQESNQVIRMIASCTFPE